MQNNVTLKGVQKEKKGRESASHEALQTNLLPFGLQDTPNLDSIWRVMPSAPQIGRGRRLGCLTAGALCINGLGYRMLAGIVSRPDTPLITHPNPIQQSDGSDGGEDRMWTATILGPSKTRITNFLVFTIII